MNRGRAAAITANPVLIGAVTTLVVIVAVFLSYNANQGLPFVPTYDLYAQLPSGGKLVKGNDVRLGGYRIGAVNEIKPMVVSGPHGTRKAIARIKLKLDKKAEPLPVDTKLAVRAKSALGLKYIEVTPGHSQKMLKPGDTIGLANSTELSDFEDVLGVFNQPTRIHIRQSLVGFSNSLAGRGTSLNDAIVSLNPLFLHLTPVMETLSDPNTRLAPFIDELAAVTEQLAPVAETQARTFSEMADTFAAFAANPGALQDTIAKSPGTLSVGTRSLRIQRPFLNDTVDLTNRLRPSAALLPTTLPRISSALAVGTPVLAQTTDLSHRLSGALGAFDALALRPTTLIGLRDVYSTLAVLKPAIQYIAPYQTVCDYASYFLGPLGNDFSGLGVGGTLQNQGIKLANLTQTNALGNTASSRPVDVPANQDPQTATNAGGALDALHVPVGATAIDAQGNADCEIGQSGYPNRFVPKDTRYPASNDPALGGGSHTVFSGDFPGLRGGTYKSRQLGINRLQDVP
jgi:virulence factor Mce-like protein